MTPKYNYEKNKNNYLTPPDLIRLGLFILGTHIGNPHLSRFDLDVCCSNGNIPANFYYKKGVHDGLTEDSKKYNWCNPPFDECKKWIIKAYNEQLKGNTSMLLIPVRTETSYWRDYILYNPNVFVHYLKKGYKFIDGDTKKAMGVFKNALALVLFKGVDSIPLRNSIKNYLKNNSLDYVINLLCKYLDDSSCRKIMSEIING